MPTNKQRREAARRRLERQLARRQQREVARKRYTIIASIAGTVVLIALVIFFIVQVGGDDKNSRAGSSASATATTPTPSPSVETSVANVARTTGACGYSYQDQGNTNLKNVGFPPDPKVTPTTTRIVTFNTNRGEIQMTLNGKIAPCNVQSIAYLVGRKFFDNTSCHRLVTSGIFVLQCGDPTGTGSGGPTYNVKDENLSQASYTKPGVVAMANGGANTNGSQFFIITKDSSSGLAKAYTEIGTVTKGLNIIEAVAAGGSNNSNGTGDGKPKLTLTFKTVTVAPPVTGSGTPVSAKVTTTTTVTPSPSAS
jgi:peptidyl-prolyl cis-trans isomerase B (cyclophilin B)